MKTMKTKKLHCSLTGLQTKEDGIYMNHIMLQANIVNSCQCNQKN